jgi:hypothetical protein
MRIRNRNWKKKELRQRYSMTESAGSIMSVLFFAKGVSVIEIVLAIVLYTCS